MAYYPELMGWYAVPVVSVGGGVEVRWCAVCLFAVSALRCMKRLGGRHCHAARQACPGSCDGVSESEGLFDLVYVVELFPREEFYLDGLFAHVV